MKESHRKGDGNSKETSREHDYNDKENEWVEERKLFKFACRNKGAPGDRKNE
jgi:hypothetical protein